MSIITRIHDGRIFPSMSAADRALGVCIGTTAHHIDTHGTTARIGKPYRNTPKPVTFEGVDYPSISEAARQTGKTRAAIVWSMAPKKRRPSVT